MHNICFILMPDTTFHGRRATSIENERLRVTVLHEGGHIAEILDKASGVNPLWIPPWPSIEPSTYDRAKHPEYGADSESKLLAGIMGHNLCLDIFGEPSAEEAAAGMTVHGEGSVVRYEVAVDSGRLTQRGQFPIAQMRFERQIRFGGERAIEITRNARESLGRRPAHCLDRARYARPAVSSSEAALNSALRPRARKYLTASLAEHGAYQKRGAEFDWPNVPDRRPADT